MNQSVSCFNRGQVLVIMRDSPCCRDPGTEDDSESVLIDSLSHKVLAGYNSALWCAWALGQLSFLWAMRHPVLVEKPWWQCWSLPWCVLVWATLTSAEEIASVPFFFFWIPLPSSSIEGTLLHFRLYSLCLPIVRGCVVPVDSGSHSWSSFKEDTNTDSQIVYW